MHIVSKFKDYYDSVVALGIDKELVYLRKTEEHKLEDHPVYRGRLNKHWWGHHQVSSREFTYKFSTFVIGFTGVYYPGIRIDKYDLKKVYTGYRYDQDQAESNHHFYDAKELLEFLESENITESKFGGMYHKERELGHYFKMTHWQPHLDYFAEFRVPMFLYNGGDWIVTNPKLKSYRFAKVKDPYTAFQEIAMYISGVLGVKEPDTLPISDEVKAQQRGFFNMSFRTRPGTKKPRSEKRKRKKEQSD